METLTSKAPSYILPQNRTNYCQASNVTDLDQLSKVCIVMMVSNAEARHYIMQAFWFSYDLKWSRIVQASCDVTEMVTSPSTRLLIVIHYSL